MSVETEARPILLGKRVKQYEVLIKEKRRGELNHLYAIILGFSSQTVMF